MSELKATPGPWELTAETFVYDICSVYGLPCDERTSGRGFLNIRRQGDVWRNDEEGQLANAHLIATAPEMDEALQLLVAAIKEIDKNSREPLADHFPDLISAMEYAEEVMQKARGE